MIDTPERTQWAVGETEREHALAAAKHANFLILVSTHAGDQANRVGAYNELLSLKKPFIIVLNKIDWSKKFNRCASKEPPRT